MPIARSGFAAWRNWYRSQITAHDGLVRQAHPRLQKVVQRSMAATSLRLLLRDPIRFVWHYALAWRQPEEADEPLTLDPLGFGSLVHETLETAVSALETNGGFGSAESVAIEKAVEAAAKAVARRWEAEQAVPPAIIWQNTLALVSKLSSKALAYRLDPLPNQRSWTEVPFGMPDKKRRNDLPWDPSQRVEIPNTGIVIQGQIDRLDLSTDLGRARVIDYKTGRYNKAMKEVTVNGGSELQRCLYAFAVRTLLGERIDVQASLLYPRAPEGEEALFPLAELDATLDLLAGAIAIARTNIENGLALPGIDAANAYNDFAFALPATITYLTRKLPLAEQEMGQASKIWEAE